MATRGLDYVISLVDQISAPIQGIVKEVDRLGNQGKAAMEQIGYGMAGIIATGAALKSALNPAIEMSNAVSNITATGMGAEGLGKIKKFALDFSSTFGVAATDVVDSANEIVRAIDGLTDEEVISFTKSSNILAKATGSNVQEMGSYLGTMYGIFQAEADRMGKGRWVEQMAGQATVTANMFKSSGESLSQAFTNLMSTGESKGIALAEQFAVLGNLQSVMPGGMSGTKYAAFLKGVGKAQEKLGLSFLDSQNRMKPITDILAEIKKAYGDVIDEKESIALSKAFGSDDAVAVISYLLPKIHSLKDNIQQIGEVNNLDEAMRISHIVTDVWERFAQILNNIRIIIGGQILDQITPFLNRIADAGTYFVKWLQVNKNIARWLGYIVGGIIALTAVIPVVMLVVGLFKMWKVAFMALWLPFKAFGAVVFKAFTAFSVFGIALTLIYVLRKELWAFLQGAIKGFLDWGVSFQPITQALGRVWGIVSNIITKFAELFGLTNSGVDSLTAWTSAGEVFGFVLGGAFQFAVDAIAFVINILGILLDTLANVVLDAIAMWQDFYQAITSGDILGAMQAIWSGVLNIIKDVWQGLKYTAIEAINWVIDKLNMIGAGIEPIKLPVEIDIPKLPDVTSKTSLIGGIADIAVQSGQATHIGSIPQPNLPVPKGKTLSGVANTNKTVINHINVTAQTNAQAPDIARAIAEHNALRG